MDDHDEENRPEQNLFVRSGKSEAEVTIITEDRARRIVLLKLTTDRHEASRSLRQQSYLLLMMRVLLLQETTQI